MKKLRSDPYEYCLVGTPLVWRLFRSKNNLQTRVEKKIQYHREKMYLSFYSPVMEHNACHYFVVIVLTVSSRKPSQVLPQNQPKAILKLNIMKLFFNGSIIMPEGSPYPWTKPLALSQEYVRYALTLFIMSSR